MANLRFLPPVQYNFGLHWLNDLQPILARPAVIEAFERIQFQRIEMFETLHENGDLGPEPHASAYLDLKIHEVEVLGHQLDWLRDELDAVELSDLSFAIAEELHPNQVWEIVENDDIHSVVTNVDRTLVFDIKLYDRLSGYESLIYAGEEIRSAHKVNTERLNEFLALKRAALELALQESKHLLDS
jgi:hypothetical protein